MKKDKPIKYTLAYLPPDAPLIKSLATAFPWTREFVRMVDSGLNGDDHPTLKFVDVVVALGDIFDSGIDKDTGKNSIGVYYEIAAVPDHLSEQFEDIVAGKGDVFKELRREIDMVISCMLNSILQDVEEDIASGKLTKESVTEQAAEEDDNRSRIYVG